MLEYQGITTICFPHFACFEGIIFFCASPTFRMTPPHCQFRFFGTMTPVICLWNFPPQDDPKRKCVQRTAKALRIHAGPFSSWKPVGLFFFADPFRSSPSVHLFSSNSVKKYSFILGLQLKTQPAHIDISNSLSFVLFQHLHKEAEQCSIQKKKLAAPFTPFQTMWTPEPPPDSLKETKQNPWLFTTSTPPGGTPPSPKPHPPVAVTNHHPSQLWSSGRPETPGLNTGGSFTSRV